MDQHEHYLNNEDEEIPPALSALDESFRCKICREYCVIAVTISDKECGE
jgi:hypothetical protein